MHRILLSTYTVPERCAHELDHDAKDHSIGIVSDGCMSLKLIEERDEFVEMSESTLLLDGMIIRLTRQKSFNSFGNNTSLNLCYQRQEILTS